MKEYEVQWAISIDADSPEKAAKEALKILLNPIYQSTFFSAKSNDMDDPILVNVKYEGLYD